MSRARSSWVEDSRLLARRISPREAVAEHPEDLVADVGLEAVDGQDHPAGGRGHPPEPLGVGEREGEQLVVAVQQVGDGAEAEGHAAADQLGMDLGDAAVLGMPQGADQGDDVEAELVLRQGEAPLLLGAEGDVRGGGSAGWRQRRTWSRSRTVPSRVVTDRWAL